MDEEKGETTRAARGWTKPVAEEVRMDAEIGSYQADDGDERG